MFIDDGTIHSLISDYLNQEECLSETEIVSVEQNYIDVSVIVCTGELGKVKKKYEINIQFNEVF
jgi:hypothetical protein